MRLLLFVVIGFHSTQAVSQSYEGVVKNTTGEPLVYVNVGLMGSPYGTTTNEQGVFKLTIKKEVGHDSIRFSMIGYIPKTISTNDLKATGNVIQLDEDITYLDEVVVNSTKQKVLTVGTKATSRKVVTGWGNYGTGGERGIGLDLGDGAWIKEVSFFVANNGYDSILLRLHIRALEGESPGRELLHENIYIPVKTRSGWITTDLSRYNLTMKGRVVLSLEWLKAWGKCNGYECLLFSMSLTKGTLFAKEASEAVWTRKSLKSPGMYLTIAR
jgi:hypothetical protein